MAEVLLCGNLRAVERLPLHPVRVLLLVKPLRVEWRLVGPVRRLVAAILQRLLGP